ncbi:MAG TPA: ATP synthase F1 subunit epsilon [Daejeonella sp.]|nr:ATP synthase F1 subunit epsilon [Daejeonella sp.]
MTLEILTPDNTVYEGEITSVSVPGTLGSFEILKDHAPIISTLEDGKVTIRIGGGVPDEIFFITGGVVEVLNNQIMLLAEGVEHK